MALQFPSDWTGCHAPDRASGWMARPNPSPAEKSVFTKWRQEPGSEREAPETGKQGRTLRRMGSFQKHPKGIPNAPQ